MKNKSVIRLRRLKEEVLKAKAEAQKELENKDVSEEYPIEDDPVAEETKVSETTKVSGNLDESVEVKKGTQVNLADIKFSRK